MAGIKNREKASEEKGPSLIREDRENNAYPCHALLVIVVTGHPHHGLEQARATVGARAMVDMVGSSGQTRDTIPQNMG